MYTSTSLEIRTQCVAVPNCLEIGALGSYGVRGPSIGFSPYPPQCRLYAPVSASNTITRRWAPPTSPSVTYTSFVFGSTTAPVGLSRPVGSLLLPVCPCWPICSRNLPALVNLSTWASLAPPPVTQTLLLLSTDRPCSFTGHS